MRAWARRGSQAASRLAALRPSTQLAHPVPVMRPEAERSPQGDGRLWVLRWSLPSLRALAMLLAGVLAVCLWWWWTGRPREVIAPPTVLSSGVAVDAGRMDAGRMDAVQASGAAPQGPVVVHVIGLVRRPGLVRLPPGSRVADAVAAAGGLTDPGAQSSVNLARLLLDGEQVAVGVGPATGGAESTVSLSTATAEQLDSLPGIGPVIAARIVAWRTAHGPFRSVEQLGDVPGIGPSLLSQLSGAARP